MGPMERTSSFIDFATGEVTLRSEAPALRPRMKLREFALSPLAKRFRKGFENRHGSYTGYSIGAYTLAGTDFVVTLGFISPTFLVPPNECTLRGIALFRCAHQGVAQARVWWLAPFRLLGDVFQPRQISPEQWRAAQVDSEHRCRQWLSESLGQRSDAQPYPPWGSIRLVPAHPRDGCLIEGAVKHCHG
jgi:hypothetical protein